MSKKRLRFSFNVFYFTGCLAAHAALAQPPAIDAVFFSTLRTGDTARLREALHQGASPNARDVQGNTPLMHAAVYGDIAAMHLLLENGGDVDATNHAGATALMRAATDPEKVELLLKRGAEVNTRSGLGNTALMLAARPANPSGAVALLLAQGADARATNNWGATALMAAAAGGDVRSVQLLLKHGADVNAQPAADPMGFLLGGARSALMWAAFRGDTEILKLLIDAGADVNGTGMLGTPLTQAAWADRTSAARLLIERGAKVNQSDLIAGYSPLHWAASSDDRSPELVNLLLSHGANPNLGGGEHVDAFMGTLQTPLMLARRRGDSPIVGALRTAGATNAAADRSITPKPARTELPDSLETAFVRTAINRAMAPLQKSSIESKEAFLRHANRQDCISCHQQMLPMAAIGLARKHGATVNARMEAELVKMVSGGDMKDREADWQAIFHPEPAHSKGYALLAMAIQDYPADPTTDSWVHHLATIQGEDGQWFNNLARPPIQTGDVGATALAVHALHHYPIPGRQAEFNRRIERAQRWLWSVEPSNTENRVYQLLGLAWSGAPATKLQSLARALAAQQRADGGWAQLPGLTSDAYATGQAIYALRVAADMSVAEPVIERGLRFLLATQLEDGTWHVRRRAFPFQPTMNSGFPHGRDSWISATASSWAVMALSLPKDREALALKR